MFCKERFGNPACVNRVFVAGIVAGIVAGNGFVQSKCENRKKKNFATFDRPLEWGPSTIAYGCPARVTVAA